MWDVIIVGARCAGSATALLLARHGLKVLLLDRASFPSDTLSTHFLWPRGCSYLNRWGLLDQVLAQTPCSAEIGFARDGIAFVARTPLNFVESRLRRVHGDGASAVETHASIRRLVLDKILLDSAVAAGAEFRAGFTVKDVIFEEERAVGVVGTIGKAQSAGERADLVIGADGRQSDVAASVGAAKFDERAAATFAYWSYFSGLAIDRPVMEKRGRLAVVIVPTNFEACMTLVFGPKEWFTEFRKDYQTNFFRAIAFVNSDLGELVRSGRREERFYGIGDQRAFKRQCVGPGWLLVGDAACVKDQCTAIGMTHAFRDAELAATCVGSWFSGDRERSALSLYESRRSEDLQGYYDFVDRSAGMAPATLEDLQFMRGLQQDQSAADSFAAMYGDSLPVGDFIGRVRPAVLATAPIGQDTPSPAGFAALRIGER